MNASARRCEPLRGLGAGILALSVLGTAPRAAAQVEEPTGYRLLLPSVEAQPGQTIVLTVRGENEKPVQGFSMALRYPAPLMTVVGVDLKGTILEAIGTEYCTPKISPERGTFILGVLVDAEPPFDGSVIPSVGMPLDWFHVHVTVSPLWGGDLEFRLEDGLGTPPVQNLFSVENQALPATELTEGVIHVPGEPAIPGPFVSGDANRDLKVDISDCIRILQYVFFGGEAPRCLAAADSNGDERVDISDPIYIVNHLFLGGPAPLPPSGDPPGGRLGCAAPPGTP